MTNITRYNGRTDRRLSNRLWQEAWREMDRNDPSSHYFDFDDFTNFPQHVSDQDTQKYSTYIDTGVTLKQKSTLDLGNSKGVVRGELEVAGNDADNDEGSIQAGGNTGPEVVISDTAGSNKLLIFEARISKASIDDNALAFAIGLAEPGKAGANALVDNTGEIADMDFIGFQVLHADGEIVKAVYRKAGQTKQVVAATALTMEAGVYYKMGFVYDPNESADYRIKFFVDNVDIGSYVTATNIAAATFPDGEALSRIFATKVGAAAESKAQMDWWGIFQSN